jgi:hypothetical protein
MTTLRIVRKGLFEVSGSCPYQCRDPGWKEYRYQVTIEADSVFTPEGWIIDNREIAAYWESSEASTPDSCEGLASRGLRYFVTYCQQHSIKPRTIAVRVFASEDSWFDAQWQEGEAIS